MDRDYILNRNIYEEQGVQEYWIIDPDEEKATFLRRDDESFVEMEPHRGRFDSEVLKGFYLQVAWLWAENRPSILRTATAMFNEFRAQS